MNSLAPLALFVYNRPHHTRQTIESLKANHLAPETEFFIFADGAKSDKDEEAIKQVADYIATVDGFKSVTIVKQEKNLGLANSIINGVTQLSESHGKFIVFEDDLICSKHTLTYLNEALERYQDEEEVYHVCSYMYPIKLSDGLPETFFYRASHSLGWASWKRAWDKFNPDIDHLISQFDEQKIKDFTFDGKMNFWKQMNDFKNGKNNSWAIRWYASVFLNNGLALNVTRSLINNIGHDGSGVHSNVENTYDIEVYPHPIKEFPKEISENKIMYNLVKTFYANRKGSWFDRGIRFLRTKLA
ncbi:MAG TPA: glycosyltransferase family A protein [Pelobium sp.]|nr:glycosyltransferase family A protein [Pelobium sp.]